LGLHFKEGGRGGGAEGLYSDDDDTHTQVMQPLHLSSLFATQSSSSHHSCACSDIRKFKTHSLFFGSYELLLSHTHTLKVAATHSQSRQNFNNNISPSPNCIWPPDSRPVYRAERRTVSELTPPPSSECLLQPDQYIARSPREFTPHTQPPRALWMRASGGEAQTRSCRVCVCFVCVCVCVSSEVISLVRSDLNRISP